MEAHQVAAFRSIIKLPPRCSHSSPPRGCPSRRLVGSNLQGQLGLWGPLQQVTEPAAVGWAACWSLRRPLGFAACLLSAPAPMPGCTHVTAPCLILLAGEASLQGQSQGPRWAQCGGRGEGQGSLLLVSEHSQGQSCAHRSLSPPGQPVLLRAM